MKPVLVPEPAQVLCHAEALMPNIACRWRGLPVGALILCLVAFSAPSPPQRIGIVLMHGKDSSPKYLESDLRSPLERQGFLVANLDMPWSRRHAYDANVASAERQVEGALDGLRTRGATSVFVAGHSQGGLFALYFGGKHSIDGVVAIAPGGNAGSPLFREQLGDSVRRARALIADGKGDGKTTFMDFDGSRGAFPVTCTPASYLGWFDPDGAMNELRAVRNLNPKVPVLFIVPKRDYPFLLQAKRLMFDGLPAHPLTRLFEPDSDHLGAPSASRDEIVRWTREVARD